MVERCFTEFRDAVRAGAAEAGDPKAQLIQAGLAYTAFARRWPARYALNFVYMRPRPRATRPRSRRPPTTPSTTWWRSVQRYLDEDDPRQAEVELVARGIWSGLHGYVSLSQARPGIGWPDDRKFIERQAQAWLGPPAE